VFCKPLFNEKNISIIQITDNVEYINKLIDFYEDSAKYPALLKLVREQSDVHLDRKECLRHNHEEKQTLQKQKEYERGQ
jgi:hypothetical protein